VKRVVLDASALVAFFEGEPGAEQVEELIARANDGKAELLMSIVNWGETFCARWRKQGERAAYQTLTVIAGLPISLFPADQIQTQIACEIKMRAKLPYADSFAASLAKTHNAAIATADADFEKVADQFEILFIR